ncbi:hypothetical protein ACFY2T_26470 [Streptomyces sp. NPDC001260]|uniref:maltokinase N-terminal cap-like domain-containing protein n=1 Tax=Streptomyces sp. NPDC001260 TaxID=3364551 RepID=UPI0036C328F5
MVAVDTSGPEPVAHHVPLTYRGAPLPGAEHALVGTMEHGVLGPRWAYDGCHDPVLYTELLALIEGRAPAMAQSITGTAMGAPSWPVEVTDDEHGTTLPAPGGTTLRVHRVLDPTAPDTRPADAIGHVTGAWQSPNAPQGTRARALFAVLYGPSAG